ncbi:hypothetical protein BDR03DRAFT_981019 [Suillus americanus]|nr:hypothetical protein BDR03DRAFT_981019 [Suillus americanus]
MRFILVVIAALASSISAMPTNDACPLRSMRIDIMLICLRSFPFMPSAYMAVGTDTGIRPHKQVQAPADERKRAQANADESRRMKTSADKPRRMQTSQGEWKQVALFSINLHRPRGTYKP